MIGTESLTEFRPSGSKTRETVFDSDDHRPQSDFPLRGMFVHCLTSHNGQKLTFTSSRKPVGTRSKMITRIGRHPWIVEIVEFLHPQSKQISLWTLPTTACLVCVCDCLKADQAEKSEWWCLYQCMGRIRQEFYRDSQRIQNAFETVALELTGDKWKPSQTFFQKHPSQTR